MRKKVLWIGVVCALALGAGWFWLGGDDGGENGKSDGARAGRGRRGADEAPPAVTAATARRGDIDVTLSALGTVAAHNAAVVKARVSGLLQRIAFQEGQRVKAGDLLAEIDPRPFQAQLDQAAGQLARDQALLANARIDLARYRDLLARNSIARQQVDTQAALVKQYEGAVQTDRGNAENARLQLSFTRITAPIDGRLGLRRADAGNMVGASDADGIVTITQTQPIAAVFSVPAGQLGAVRRGMRAGEAPGAGASETPEALAVEAWDQENRNLLARGALRSVDNQIDTTTGTVKLKAEFANADEALFPNQFVNIRLRVARRQDAVLIPAAAVLQGRQGEFVYVVDAAGKTVSVRPLKIGVRTNDTVSVEEGLTAGERVIIDGVDSLRDGAKIVLVAREAMPGDAHATPGDDTAAAPETNALATNAPAVGAQASAHQEAKKETRKATPQASRKNAPSAAAQAVTRSAQERPPRPGGLVRARAPGKAEERADEKADEKAGGKAEGAGDGKTDGQADGDAGNASKTADSGRAAGGGGAAGRSAAGQ